MEQSEKELFNEKIKGLYAAIDSNAEITNQHMRGITNTLGRIEVQTTKTNGKVHELEEKIHTLEINEKEHIISCPQAGKIKEMDDTLIEYKFIRKYPKFSLAAMVLFGVVLILLSLAQLGVL